MTILSLLIVLLGLALMADGIGSIIKYWDQTPIEHLVRVLRILAGLAIVVIGILLV